MKKCTLLAFLLVAFIFVSGQTQVVPVPGDHTPVINKFQPGEYWKCDSTNSYSWNTGNLDWDLYLREFFTYDQRKNVTLYISLIFDNGTMQWKNDRKKVNEYYSDFTLKTESEFAWNLALNAWIEIEHSEYDTEGRPILTIVYDYDYSTVTITGGSKHLYSYSGLVNEEVRQEYDINTFTWSNDWRKIWNYQNGHKTTFIYQEWVQVVLAYENDTRITYSYNPEGLLNEEITYNWDQVMMTWQYAKKVVTYYNSGKEDSQYYYLWNTTTTSFEYSERSSTIYNTEGQRIEAYTEIWNALNLLWEPAEKYIWTYHSNDSLFQTNRYNYNPNSLQYLISFSTTDDEQGRTTEIYTCGYDANYEINWGARYEYQYGTYGITVNYIQDWTNGAWVNYLKHTYTYDQNNNLGECLTELFENGSFRNLDKLNYFYSGFIGIEERPSINEFCFFSNPITPGKTVNCPGISGDYSVSIINMSGQKVYSSHISSGDSFCIKEDLAAGNYIMMIDQAGKNHISGKIIITR